MGLWGCWRESAIRRVGTMIGDRKGEDEQLKRVERQVLVA